MILFLQKRLHVPALVALAIVLVTARPGTAVASSADDAATVSVTVEAAPAGGGGGGGGGGDGGGDDDGPSAGLREESIQRKIDESGSGQSSSVPSSVPSSAPTAVPDTIPDTESSVRPRRERLPRSVDAPSDRTETVSEPDLHPASGTGSRADRPPWLPGIIGATDWPSLLSCPTSLLCIDRLWEGYMSGSAATARFGVFPLQEIILWIIGLLVIVLILRFLWILLQRFYAWVRRHSGWYFFNVIILVILSYAAVVVYEYSRASESSVQFIVTSGDITLGCTASVSIGTIEDTGDTGAYSSERAIECSVATSESAGYSLSWRVRTGSGGTATGHLINTDEDTIAPYAPLIADTPETWSVDSVSNAWGARLSSTSETVSTAVWGTDGIDERWLNVGTGAFVIAVRTSSNELDPDIERIGFRVEIGTNASRPVGTYSSEVLFTATTN